MLSHAVLPEVLHRARAAADKKDCAYSETSCRATNACQLQPPGTTIPKWDKGEKSPLLPLSSPRSSASGCGRGHQAALPPGVAVGGNPAAPAKLRKEAVTLIYICK